MLKILSVFFMTFLDEGLDYCILFLYNKEER